MKSSVLKLFLNELIGSKEFNAHIQEELNSYMNARVNTGTSVPILFEEDANISVSIEELFGLLQYYIQGGLSCAALEYIGDALELGEKVEFQSDAARELVFEFSNPEINGNFSVARAQELLHALKA